MKTIWKEIIVPNDIVKVSLPKGAEVLTVQVDRNGEPCIWFICNPDAEKETRFFKVYGTGHVVNDIIGKYIGTFQLSRGIMVFHLFEIYD